MTPRRTATTVLSGTLALVALAGCTKPTPAVTLVSDGKTARSDATLYCVGAQTPAKHDCAKSGHGPRVLAVREGDQVGIDVDKTVAQHGWYLVDVDAQRRTPLQTTHYDTYTADFTGRQTRVITLQVVSLTHAAENAKPNGTWVFQLVPR